MMSRFKSKTNGGFSLIELMVVMAVMAVLMSLSGGLMQKSINQQTRQIELEQVQQLFKKLSYRAYYGGIFIKVRLEKNQMLITYSNNDLNEVTQDNIMDENRSFETELIPNHNPNEQIDFEQLTFVAQDYIISTKGIISPNAYEIFWQEDIKQFSLKSLFSSIAL